MKSGAQVWFSTGGAANGCRTRLGTRRVVRLGRFDRSAQFTGCTRLWFQGWLWSRKWVKHFQKPHRGRRATMSVSAAITAASRRLAGTGGR